jgi:Bacterial surface proteins containing Ig-like domains
VTAVGGGSATITAKAGGFEATCAVTVTIPVDGISLDKTTLTLTKDQTYTLVATVTPDNASDKTVTWNSSNAAIVKVDANGLVTALAEGKATITAKAGGFEATCEVTVQAPGHGSGSGGNEDFGNEDEDW